mmetsp:Transcript_5506/g.13043  ORF Transcript_5506/g.13043 Transcript_5506/m.13043 type:complete len:324 (-) Transcript_5506:893-1864(-)
MQSAALHVISCHVPHIPHTHVLELLVVLHAIRGPLPPDPRLLDASEGRFNRREYARVDGHHPVLEPLRHTPHTSHVTSEEITRQTHRYVVGLLDDILLVLEGKESSQGAEDLLLLQICRCTQIPAVEHRGLDERAFCEAWVVESWWLAGGASTQHLGTLADGVLPQPDDLIHPLLVDHRPHTHALIQTMTHLELVDSLCEPLCKRLEDRFVDEEPVGADARLPAAAELARHSRRNCIVEICVFEHNEGRVASQLEGDLLDGAGSLLHQQLAHRRGASEGYLAHLLTGAQLLSHPGCLIMPAGHHVDHTTWYPGLLSELRQGQR